jgi:hypothetical protein
MPKQKKNKPVESQKAEQFFGQELEYVTTKGFFDNLVAECKGDVNQYALDTINETFGLLGHVTTITFIGD